MARVEVIQTLGSRSAFADKVRRQSSAKLAKTMKALEPEVVRSIQDVIKEEMVTDRDPSRRKKGTRRLINSIVCDVDWDGHDFPVRLVAHAIGDQHKIGALEQGSPQHYIPLVAKAGATKKDFLFFPRTRDKKTGGPIAGRPGVYGQHGKVGKGKFGNVVKMDQTWHSGTKAYRFLERGTRRVVDRRLRGTHL